MCESNVNTAPAPLARHTVGQCLVTPRPFHEPVEAIRETHLFTCHLSRRLAFLCFRTDQLCRQLSSCFSPETERRVRSETRYLTRQTVSLREVNESRLKIYEQLEQNVAELERTNQRLQQESRSDKKRIKSLGTSVDLLEKKCEELQDLLDNLNSDGRRRTSTGTSEGEAEDEATAAQDVTDFLGFQESPFESEVVRLRSALSRFKCQISKEHEQREQMQAEIDGLIQENMHLQEQVLASQEREHQCLNLQMEMDLLDDKNMCPSCRMFTKMNADPRVEPEEELVGFDHFSMMQLKNGVVVYGDQDSLPPDVEATAVPSNGIAAAETISTQTRDAENQVSLLGELDAQYRTLIEKYEALLDARCRSLDDDNRSPTKSPDLAEKKRGYPSLSAASDTESAESTLSSGFSEPTEHRSVAVQTERADDRKPSALDLSSGDPVGQHFAHGPPEYKKLFAEIFAVLKQTVEVKLEERDVPERRDAATSPTKRADADSGACTNPQRKLKTNLDLSKLCDLEKKHAFPFVAVQCAKVQTPGNLTYAEAARKGCVVRHRPAVRPVERRTSK